MRLALTGLMLVLASPAALAQDSTPTVEPNGDIILMNEPVDKVATASGMILRGLDKVTGQTTDFTLKQGESYNMGALEIVAGECRYPADDPQANAYAWLTIRDNGAALPAFEGWMIANAPALNALDHQRYDVWVIRCSISEG